VQRLGCRGHGEEEKRVILMGNPGCGTSTLLNNLLELARFESGPSKNGGGRTTKLKQVRDNHNVIFCDTPGLHDAKQAGESARELATCLQLGGKHRIIFVLQYNDGCVRPEDMQMFRCVRDSVTTSTGTPFPLRIIVNKCKDSFLTNEARRAWFLALLEKGPHSP
jgi:GTPase Era involved in 16S rRNA processing